MHGSRHRAQTRWCGNAAQGAAGGGSVRPRPDAARQDAADEAVGASRAADVPPARRQRHGERVVEGGGGHIGGGGERRDGRLAVSGAVDGRRRAGDRVGHGGSGQHVSPADGEEGSPRRCELGGHRCRNRARVNADGRREVRRARPAGGSGRRCHGGREAIGRVERVAGNEGR